MVYRIDAAVEAHLQYALEISDYTTASIRNAGQVPEAIAVRHTAEASQYGDMWRKLLMAAVMSAASAAPDSPGVSTRASSSAAASAPMPMCFHSSTASRQARSRSSRTAGVSPRRAI